MSYEETEWEEGRPIPRRFYDSAEQYENRATLPFEEKLRILSRWYTAWVQAGRPGDDRPAPVETRKATSRIRAAKYAIPPPSGTPL